MRWAIISCILLGITVTSAYAYEVTYPVNDYRLKNPPTYCIEKPYDSNDSDVLVPLAVSALENWQDNLQDAESDNPQYWKIDSKIIPTGGTKSGCDVTIYFVAGTQEQNDDFTRTVGTMFYYRDEMEIYYSDIDLPKVFNVILHEIGHSLGLSHYVADDNEVNRKF
ncbi:MAG: hypothetical protein ACKOCQ_01170, partial [Candidatus Nitrosotenuis sp.]